MEARAGELSASAEVTVDLFASGTVETRALLSVGESAPLVLTLVDDAGGPWEGEVACEADDRVASIEDGRVHAAGPGETEIRCLAAGTVLATRAQVQPLPSIDEDALTWARDTHIRIDDGGLIRTRRVVFEADWIWEEHLHLGSSDSRRSLISDSTRLSQPIRLTTDRGTPAWLVLESRPVHQGIVSYMGAGYAWVVAPEGERDLRVVAELLLGWRSTAKGAYTEGEGIGWPRVRPGGLCLRRSDHSWVDGDLVEQADRDAACPAAVPAPPGVPICGVHVPADETRLGCMRLTRGGVGLERLEELTELEELSLHRVDDTVMERIGMLRKLRELTLRDGTVTDAGLAHLIGLDQLKSVHLGDTRVTEEGKRALREALPGCRVF